MNAIDIVERLRAAPPDEPLNWAWVRNEVIREYAIAGAAERKKLLHVYTVIMDAMECSLSEHELDTFRTARRQDYSGLLVSECSTEGVVSPEALAAVTSREIEAGRMSPNDELRRLAILGTAVVPEVEDLDAPVKRRWSLNRALQWGAISGACYTAAGAAFPEWYTSLGHSDLGHVNVPAMVGAWIGSVAAGALMFAAAATIINKVRRG